MALTMVHLLAAANWAEGWPAYRDCPEFYLGVISPDAIHVRDKGDKSHKDEIHLHNWQSPHPEEVIRYWRERCAPFDVGYGVHVLTDGQWVPMYKQRLPGILRVSGRLDINAYYRDTWVTDFRLLAEDPKLQRILELLARAEAPEDHPLLTRHELDEWRQLTLEAYRGPCPRQGEPEFITAAYARAFARECVPMINQTWRAAMGER